ncbi:MAG: hypothetical protein C4533_05475 [Candidatus Omnitrophota bacterium]|jgi:hypothetical protein|nr:MAG: hypothetical protein C4533_05475 [Candidatus Omnitrophota bacterium]
MDKHAAIDNFLRNLRMVLNNAFMYNKEHPYFLKSVDLFKGSLDALFSLISPLKIGFTPSSLFIGSEHLESQPLYEEIARIFHNRKIKSIEIKDNVTTEELVDFLSTVTMPVRDLIQQGNIRAIFNKAKFPDFLVEELDYSIFLSEQGSELKDLWGSFLREAVVNNDSDRIADLSDNFGTVVRKLSSKDFLDDQRLQADVKDFLKHLKESQRDKFYQCSKEIFKWAMNNKHNLDNEQLDKMKAMLKELEDSEFARLFSEEILEDDKFDLLSFQLFSRFIVEGRHNNVSNHLANDKALKDNLKDSLSVKNKVKELLSAPEAEMGTSKIFHNTLKILLTNITYEEGIYFDRKLLEVNYRFVLVSIFSTEEEMGKLKIVANRLSQVVEHDKQDMDLDWLVTVLEAINAKKKNFSRGYKEFSDLEKRLANFVETMFWQGSISLQMQKLVDSLEVTSMDSHFYLEKMFVYGQINQNAIKLFLRFFPSDIAIFYKNIQDNAYKTEMMAVLTEALKGLKHHLVLDILKTIYSTPNQFLKIEALRAMADNKIIDQAFLLNVISGQDITLKKGAVYALLNESESLKKAIAILLDIPSPFGIRNHIIIENLQIVDELILREAINSVIGLSNRRFFWNKALREKAAQTLRKLNVRTGREGI